MLIWLAYKSHSEGAGDPFTSLLPVGLLSINAVLAEAGYRSRVLNLSNMSRDQILGHLKSDRPSVVGLSMFTHNRVETLGIAGLVKQQLPDCCVVLGGPHATGRWRQILESCPAVDVVVAGEGEAAMLELVRGMTGGERGLDRVAGLAIRQSDGKAVLTPGRIPIADLDALPLAARYLDDPLGVDPRLQLEFIITSRGCPAACRFCSSPRFWGRTLRFRSPASIIEEIRYLRDRYGLIYFSIRDDTFTADRNRVIELCRLLLAERLFILWNCQSRVNAVDGEMLGWMKRAGCECIQLGIESGSERVLKALGKRVTLSEIRNAANVVRQAGINLSVYLIAGVFADEDADLDATGRLLADIRPADGHVSPLVYYPGTALFEDAVRGGLIPDDLFERESSSVLPVMNGRDAGQGLQRLMTMLNKAGTRGQFTRKDFVRQKELLGYCHATNLMSGEFFAEKGDSELAERDYREIVRREPDNPWGWLALGELYAETDRFEMSRDSFERLCEIVPAHAPGFSALGDVARMVGDEKGARAAFQRAKTLMSGGQHPEIHHRRNKKGEP